MQGSGLVPTDVRPHLHLRRILQAHRDTSTPETPARGTLRVINTAQGGGSGLPAEFSLDRSPFPS